LVKIQTIEKLFFYILLSSFLLLPLAFVLNLKHKTWMTLLLALYGVCFCVFNYLAYNKQLNKLLPKQQIDTLYNVYTYTEYLVFASILWANIPRKGPRIFILISSILFAAFMVLYTTSYQIQKIDAIPIGIETILLFIYIFFFFSDYFAKTATEYVYNHYCFWICVGILIYLGGSFFLNILANNISNIHDYWYLTYIAETIKNALFVIAIFLISKRIDEKVKSKVHAIPYLDLI